MLLRLALFAPLLATLLLSTAAEECVILVTTLANACADVSAGLWAGDLLPLKVGAPTTTCAAVTAGVAAAFTPFPTRPACCDAARAFAVNGCVCDPAVVDMTEGMGRLPRGTDVPLFMAGVMHLTQASECAWAAYGGPILDACSSDLGPCGGAAFPEAGAAAGAVPSI